MFCLEKRSHCKNFHILLKRESQISFLSLFQKFGEELQNLHKVNLFFPSWKELFFFSESGACVCVLIWMVICPKIYKLTWHLCIPLLAILDTCVIFNKRTDPMDPQFLLQWSYITWTSLQDVNMWLLLYSEHTELVLSIIFYFDW